MEEGWWNTLRNALGNRRVEPVDPPGRTSVVPDNEQPDDVSSQDWDDAATWTTHITYRDSKGAITNRLITIRSITGQLGEPEVINAICHKRNALRGFRVDRIVDMACVMTGELIDPRENCLHLHRMGALKINDKALTHLMKLMVFMARCDGEFHQLERASLEDWLARYALRFGGDDETLSAAMIEVDRLAPDSDALIKSLKAIYRMPRRAEICRYALDCTASIIDADGRHAPEEVHWAVEVSNALKQFATDR